MYEPLSSRATWSTSQSLACLTSIMEVRIIGVLATSEHGKQSYNSLLFCVFNESLSLEPFKIYRKFVR